MIPLRDHNPTRSVPVLTYIFIAINVVVWLMQASGGMYATKTGLGGSMAGFTMIPAEVTRGVDIGSSGARVDMNGPTLQPVWLTIFTSMFMHGGLLHLAGNMLYLFIFGNNIEDALGKPKFLIFYLLCGLIAALSQIFWDVNSTIPTLGASGAIAGVLGAYLALYPHARVDSLVGFVLFFRVAVPAWILLSLWIVTQFFSHFLGSTGGPDKGGVAYMAHIGGFVAGYLLIRLFKPHVVDPREVEYRTYDAPSGRWNGR